jgi:hypothetical protein
MKEGNFRFMLLSIIMLQNMVRSQTKISHQPEKKSSFVLDNLGLDKHQRNRVRAHGKKKKKIQQKIIHGRLPIPDDFVSDMPHGFDERLRKVDSERKRVYTHVDLQVFDLHESDLIEIIRSFIPQVGFGRPPISALLRARTALHKWLVDKMVEEQDKKNEFSWQPPTTEQARVV